MWNRKQLLRNSFFYQNKFKKCQPNFIRTFLSTPLPEITQMGPNINSYKDLYKFSIENPEAFWKVISNRIDWNKPFDKVLDGDFNSAARWFVNGKLNVSENCVDRHAKKDPNRIALIYERDEPNQHEFITYGQLQEKVVKYASILRNDVNLKKGDRVAFYLPTNPTSVAMALACARLGVIHSIVFAGFSSEALASRINDAGAKVVITCDFSYRGGKKLEIKKVVDEALKKCPEVKNVLIDSYDDGNIPKSELKHERDLILQDLIRNARNVKDHIEYVDSNDPLFILYTSGSTGKPKGLYHSSGGYLLYAMFTHQYAFDYKPGDLFSCVADIGWITGHSYVMYGPLANGGTTLLFESTPTYPNPGRYWEMVERLKLTHFYGAPTALRLLMKYGNEWVTKYNRSSLKILGSVGEPINDEAWKWFNDVVGEKRCNLIDTWWQTETGGIMIAPRPASPDSPILPAMPMRPFLGIKPKLIKLSEKSEEGALCIEQPWPGLALGVWSEPKRFKETYFTAYPPHYFSGDGALCNSNGYYKIAGRMDDVINVTGHRLGTAEVEDILSNNNDVSESAVVGIPHNIKGEGIFAYVVLKEKVELDKSTIEKELKALCKSKIASYAIPDYILFCDGLPKTRSGKIMRRILRKIAISQYDDIGDISTLADPNVVTELINLRKELK